MVVNLLRPFHSESVFPEIGVVPRLLTNGNLLPEDLGSPEDIQGKSSFYSDTIRQKVQGATRLGATGLRAFERKSASERVSERTSENL